MKQLYTNLRNGVTKKNGAVYLMRTYSIRLLKKIVICDVHSDISAVYLGAKASETYRAQVCDHYTGTNIKIYQMELHPDCYKLNPKRLL